MKKLLIAVALLCAPQAAYAGDIWGTWSTKDANARVVFESCGHKICGKFIWLKDEAGGKVVHDEHNQDAALRSRRVVGMHFIEFAKNAEGWQGSVYNPEDGMTYAAEAKLLSDNKLEIKGCSGPLCDSEIWTRAN